MATHPGCIVSLSIALLVAGPAAADPFIRGDVDASGQLDISDVVLQLNSLFLGAGDPPCLDAADADDSGILDLTDAVSLLGHLFLGNAAPPSPFPDCGVDPSDDPLTCARYEKPGGCPPVGFPDDCNNVVGRAADRGCGRVYVWGDEHVGSEQYWPHTEPFWRQAFAWLGEPSCGGPQRTRVAFYGINPGVAFFDWLQGEGFTPVEWNGSLADVSLSNMEIIVMQPFFGEEFEPGPVFESWVQEGGALMALTGGFSGRHQDHCEAANRAIKPLGLQFDCFHTAPWGPVTRFEDHPLGAGLGPDEAPFVNGANVLDVEGFESAIVARIGDECSPAEVPDCRIPIAFTGPAPNDTLAVESDCEQTPHGGVNLPGAGLELNILSIYEPSVFDITVRVERTEPMVLVLTSYEPAFWFLELAPGAVVERLIVNGYKEQGAFAPPEVQVEILDAEVNNNYLGLGFGFDCGGGDTKRLAENAESHTGLSLRSLHGCYRAGTFTLR